MASLAKEGLSLAEESRRTSGTAFVSVRELEVRSDSIGQHFALGARLRSGTVTEFAAVDTGSACVVADFAVVAVGTCDHALESGSVVEHAVETSSCACAFVCSVHTCDAVCSAEFALMRKDTRNELACGTGSCTFVSCHHFVVRSRVGCSAATPTFSRIRTITC